MKRKERIAASALVAMSLPKRKSSVARPGKYIGKEKKFYDDDYNAALSLTIAGAEADPPTPGCISAISQGDGASQRDGRKILIRDVYVAGQITMTGAATMNAGSVKVALILDRQTNGAQFNAEDVFTDGFNALNEPFAFRVLEYQRRFEVLDQAVLEINPMAADAGDAVCTFRFSARGLNIPVNYTGATGTVSEIADNSIHMYAVGHSGMSPCTVSYVSRVRFLD